MSRQVGLLMHDYSYLSKKYFAARFFLNFRPFVRITLSFNLPWETLLSSLYAFKIYFEEFKLVINRHKEPFYHMEISRDVYAQHSLHLIKLVYNDAKMQ
jgi:hypothetical protein